MNIQNLTKQLQDIVLLYGDKLILTMTDGKTEYKIKDITDGKTEYKIKDITGMPCAKYFGPSDHVAEVIVRIDRK